MPLRTNHLAAFFALMGVLLAAVLASAGQGSPPGALTLTPSDSYAGDDFGYSLALASGTLAVGAPGLRDAAYVFGKDGTGWTERQRLTPSTTRFAFGKSLALDEDTLVVGTSGSVSPQLAGSAIIFVNDGGTWTQRTELTAADAAPFDFLGQSVALDDGTVVAGAPGDDANTGSAYVFSNVGGAWSQQAKLIASDRATGDLFGNVALSGTTIVVGAPGDDGRTGAVYVFANVGGSWIQQGKLTASDAAVGDLFGASIALEGNTLVVGALRGDSLTVDDTGAVYVFVRDGTSWREQAKLTAPDGSADDFLGGGVFLGTGGVALAGRVIAIGAPGADRDEGENVGTVYLFRRQGTSWSWWFSYGSQRPFASQGWSVALRGTQLAMGAPSLLSAPAPAGMGDVVAVPIFPAG